MGYTSPPPPSTCKIVLKEKLGSQLFTTCYICGWRVVCHRVDFHIKCVCMSVYRCCVSIGSPYNAHPPSPPPPPFFCRVLFGNLVEIRADRYASIIDTAPPQTYIVMHIYDEVRLSCATPTSSPSLLSSSPSYPVSAVLSESKPSTYTVGKDLSCGMGVWCGVV